MVKQQLLLIQLQQVLQQITTNHQLKLITIITKQLQHLAIATITIITIAITLILNTQAANSSYNYQASGSSSEEAAKGMDC